MPTKLSALPLMAALLAGIAACDREPPTTAPSVSSAEDGALLTSPGFGLGRPLGFLSADQRRLFDRGRVVFATVFTPETGKGPLFNAASCATCHVSPVVGGVGPQVETHQTAFANGVCDDLEEIGGQVIQDSGTPAFQAALGLSKEPLLLEATGTGHRTTPSVLGFGLLEAVPNAEILRRADPNDLNHDGISGRAAVSPTGEVGRFGRKDNAATLDEFLSGAFIYEMGITNADEPEEQTVHGAPLPAGVDPAPDPEITPQDFNAAVSFVRFLAPPPPRFGFGDRRGRFLFARIGCASCHTPALFTGNNPVRVLSNRVVFAYTDLLLHDMGPDLSDICLAQAEPSEFRTEPLMGLRFKTAYLHDARATSIDQAIQMHGGEATAARNRYLSLSPAERATLVSFLSRL
jgi:CxxC motif-containing protein (DUF1111 family)